MENKNIIGIIGLGYVGLPLASLARLKGFKVYGFDINASIIEKVNNNESHIEDKSLKTLLAKLKKENKKIEATDDFTKIKECDFVFICVPTPVKENHMPDLTPVKSASESIAKNMRRGQCIVLESTVYPGVTEEVMIPILEKFSNLKAGIDFDVAHCPERIDPGNKKWNVSNIPRVIGALTKDGLDKIAKVYSKIIDGEIIKLSSIKAAEAVKIIENSFRDINIAFVNELAMSFDKFGIDILEVIKGASTKPFAFMPHFPSCGVGGHCIPVDPYYLIQKAKDIGFEHKFLKLAREINNHMPDYTVKILENEMKKLKIRLRKANVGILGMTYKENIDDLRESPAFKIAHLLKKKGANVFVFEPHVKNIRGLEKEKVETLDEFLSKAQYIIVASPHKEFLQIPANKFKDAGIKIIIDGKNKLAREDFKKEGIVYRGIGHN
ncbi:UDP-N-acetyl-D-glucosamine dehydrogenase [Candidatus Pacearchaeota archaeon CG_4_9_14_3_um_filter_31_7]|nr:MAG: hypothetical protein AUJ10_00265 [Candidatus Pacearchaeota archaeon CG1_02_31_27]PIN92249.1 MAG: UDP-N-acetyl-D-glucosamine dehydrogenase [Candidatus Pacearchaeota archaeon CG10_big_fil_rev_8_21_14_0_10_31_59]PIZ81223.1 MAG: UDP-N-acetyl-D-glucosamine dehydrogenase [Candidatus Pacearchaeota archaeon CG_4_10_14_0_2_um_filter_31_10]PJA70477.1 MAG: UDP-N-acetyl-D-glucosamine dehydrogenase [Candidatus Pacearchaeota archaeon CG_4_9_14_3_um_filter_31_7]